MNPEDFIWLLALLPFVAFAALWVGLITLMGKLGSWGRLVQELGQQGGQMPRPLGGDQQSWDWQSGKVGWSSYKNCLNISTSRFGMSLTMIKLFSFGHRPLFIPWQNVQSITHNRGLFMPLLTEVKLNDSKQTRLRLPTKVFKNNPHVPAQLQGAVKETQDPYGSSS